MFRLVQHLKTFVSYILSGFLVGYSGWVSVIPVTSQLTRGEAFIPSRHVAET